MKMNLRICAKNLKDIRTALKSLSEGELESNCCGKIEGVDFDYDFVESDDLYSDDKNKIVISPNDKTKEKIAKVLVTEKMRMAGSEMASDLIDAQISNSFGTLGGSITLDNFFKSYSGLNLDLIKQQLDGIIDSVTAIYIAMNRASDETNSIDTEGP